jgi:hypothetical protein
VLPLLTAKDKLYLHMDYTMDNLEDLEWSTLLGLEIL